MIATLVWFFSNRHNFLGFRRFAKNQTSVASASLRPNGVLRAPFILLEKKLVKPENLETTVAMVRKSGRTIATLNGSFDLLHAGHLYILSQASLQADVLIVALNSDASIRAYKSADRPIISLQYRLEMMAALECVDYVTWFDETDPCMLLSKIRPDVHVNGAEYGENCIEAKTVKSLGGRIHLVDRIPTLSTSSIIEKIQKLCV